MKQEDAFKKLENQFNYCRELVKSKNKLVGEYHEMSISKEVLGNNLEVSRRLHESCVKTRGLMNLKESRRKWKN